MKKFLLLASCLFLSATAFAQIDAPVVKKWTFIVYLNGDNNLDSFGDVNINQMKQVGSSADVNVIVLRDRANQSTSAKIYYVQKGSLKTVKDFGKNLDMGDYRTMIDLFQYSVTNYPAEHYVFDIWNHGGGWGKRSSDFRDISWDDGSGHHITTPQMGIAMAEMVKINNGKKIDLIGTDACLMQMAEVVNEVGPSVTAMVASEETEPGNGWDYAAPLAFLTKNPNATGIEVGDQIAAAYITTASSGLQQSVVAVDDLMVAKEKLSALATLLAKFDVLSKDQVKAAIEQTKGFAYDDFKDIIDFLNIITAATSDVAIKTAAQDAADAVKTAIKGNHSIIDHANGLSIWLPDSYTYSSKKARYADLEWSKSTSWGVFLAALYE